MNAEKIELTGFDLIKVTPDKPSTNIPVLIAPGFATPAQDLHLIIEVLASQGFTALCPDYKYGYAGEPKKPFPFSRLPNVDLAKQRVISALATELGPLDVISHSKGAIDVVAAAKRTPLLFRNIIMDAPSGIHNWNRAEAVARLRLGETRDGQDKKRLKQEGQFTDWLEAHQGRATQYRQNFFWQCYTEIFTGAAASIHRDLQPLRDNGIKIVIVAHEGDSMFPLKTYREVLGDDAEDFIIRPGIHGSIKFDPEVGFFIADLLKANALSQSLSETPAV